MEDKNKQKQNDLSHFHEGILFLSPEATERLNKILNDPPEPNDYLKAAFKKYLETKLDHGQQFPSGE